VGNESGIAAVEYLADLDYVDETAIGVIGHSMGSGIGWEAILHASVTPKAFVVVGGWTGNESVAVDILVTVGSFDSFFSGTDLQDIANALGLPSVEPGVTYGNFSDGTARRFVVVPTNHLFETIQPTIVSESVEWMKDSLKGGTEDAHWIPSESLIYPLWLVGGFLSVVGLLLTAFPLIVILLEVPLFSKIREKPSGYSADRRTFWTFGIVYGALGLITFFPFLLIGGILGDLMHFPQSLAMSAMTWIVGTGLLALLVLYLGLRTRFDLPVKFGDLWRTNGKFIDGLLRALLIGLIVFAWFYAWTLVADWGLALDIRCFLPGFNDLTVPEAVLMPIYFVGFLIYFMVESFWFMEVMRPETKGSWRVTQLWWTVKTVFIKTIPFLIMIAFEYLGGLLAGTSLVPEMIGFSWLFFYAFTPWFAVCAAIIAFAYRLTGKHWLGPILSALICAWLLATIIAF
jgi:hypothetical protein